MYQLPPVGHSFIFYPPRNVFAHLNMSLWQHNFKIVQLPKIMRQKDDILFAQLLNRVRTSDHNSDDVKLLTERVLTSDNQIIQLKLSMYLPPIKWERKQCCYNYVNWTADKIYISN